jgi:multiple sugar transport system ATP-binding protein
MVFQNIALFPHMDVYDNISFGLRLRNFDKDEIDRRVERATEILQIRGMLDRMPDELSGGQRQRVAIGRAIVREPDVFLMDEPLANLDAKLRVHMRTELQRLHKELDTTIIYVTHDQAEAMTMSDRIAVLNDGQLQQIAPPLTCYNEPANRFVAGFIGSPSMNFVEGDLTGNGVTTESFDVEFDVGALDGYGPGDRITLGVRPEDVYISDGSESLSHPTAPFPAQTDVIEPMGDEIFVYLMIGDQATSQQDSAVTERDPDEQLLMSVDPDTDVQMDQRVDALLDRQRLHLFDTDTGEAVSHGLVSPARVDHDQRATGAESGGDD